MIFFLSASFYYSLARFNNPYFYFFRFLVRVIFLGWIVFFIGEYFGKNFLRFKKFLLISFFLIYFLIFLGFLPQFRLDSSAARWIKIGNFTLQPSEIIKPFVLIFFVFLFTRLKKYSPSAKSLIFIGFAALILLPIYLQPSLSNVLIILASLTVAFFTFLESPREFLVSLTVVFLASLLLVVLSTFWSYRVERLWAFLTKGQIHSEKFFQVEQSIIAISSGGIFGKGLGKSEMKILGLPQMLTDSIFAIYAEETGFVGSIVLLILFLLLIGWIIILGLKTREKEKYAFALGVAVWLTSQTFLHLASNTGLFVPTGVILPFLSYGPSGQLAIYFSLGLINGFSQT